MEKGEENSSSPSKREEVDQSSHAHRRCIFGFVKFPSVGTRVGPLKNGNCVPDANERRRDACGLFSLWAWETRNRVSPAWLISLPLWIYSLRKVRALFAHPIFTSYVNESRIQTRYLLPRACDSLFYFSVIILEEDFEFITYFEIIPNSDELWSDSTKM